MAKWTTIDLIKIWSNRYDSIESKGICPLCKNKDWLMEFDEYSLNRDSPDHFWVVNNIRQPDKYDGNQFLNLQPTHKKCR
ncbi:hypothetical protein [Spiroplasma endosymbiont of Othius punctulatus]|uniref:hypothetical protein n=1 Tax=Spiroplasma endosymbiont of Othius punctulatus TaxID=3066289 RepID=UPI0030CBF4EF